MRPKIENNKTKTFFERLVDCVVAALVLAVVALVVSCGDDAPINAVDPPRAPAEALSTGLESPNFVVVIDKRKDVGRPFLAPPGVCGSIGSAGGVVCNGPVTLVIPPGALADYTDICISAVNQQQLIAEFTPDGQWFAGDVSMRWNLANTSAEGEAENVTTIWFNSASGQWEAVTTEAPIDTNTTETLIRHFSKYGQEITG